jgi:hypothetical protein
MRCDRHLQMADSNDALIIADDPHGHYLDWIELIATGPKVVHQARAD